MRKKSFLWAITSVLFVAIALCVAWPLASSSPLYEAQERFGFTFAQQVWDGSQFIGQDLSDYQVASLHVGWYSDWSYSAQPEQPADATLDYVQLIRVSDAYWPPDWVAVRNAAAQQPGSLWIIGNEPECPNQGNLTPEEYAQKYNQAHTEILGADATARFAIGGIVEPSPLRFRWLESTLQDYQDAYGTAMPIDVWNIHIQILSEGPGNDGAGVPVGFEEDALDARYYELQDAVNPNILRQMVTSFRMWMLQNGFQDKELIISEMGVLQPSYYLVDGDAAPTEEERAALGDMLIENFQFQVFDWLSTAQNPAFGCPQDQNRLVQRWLWFSLNDSFWDGTHGFNGALFTFEDQALTRFGRSFIAFQNQTYRISIPSIQKP